MTSEELIQIIIRLEGQKRGALWHLTGEHNL